MLYKRFIRLQSNVGQSKGVEYSIFMSKVAGDLWIFTILSNERWIVIKYQ